VIAPLAPVQLAVARRVLGEEGARRRHLVVALSGSHAYGFPSPDSDLDLKAIHADPTERVLGLGTTGEAGNRLEVIDGVEIDYTSNELTGALRGVLQGNGNYVERILGPLILEAGPVHAGLRAVVAASLSRRLHGHYAGFARSQLQAAQRGPAPTAKRIL
jgi:uncharacterized protein